MEWQPALDRTAIKIGTRETILIENTHDSEWSLIHIQVFSLRHQKQI